MKIINLLILFLISIYVHAQEIPDPEFTNRPYLLTADNELKNLERADAQISAKAKALGYGGVETSYIVFSAKSEIRFNSANLPRIIIKIEGNVDPADLITMSKAVSKNNKRSFLQGGVGFVGRTKDVSSTYVKLEFKKIRNGVYEIILPTDITSGEFGILPVTDPNSLAGSKSNIKITCFGID